jgi:putative membrane-bound dehydrogenase-like protein
MNWLLLSFALSIDSRASTIETPVASDARLVVELVASEPDIVTPTGIAVDVRGRVWAIENQTHHRPADYKGPPGDRIRIYSDFGPDGRARQVKTFAEGFKDGMGLALARNGDLYFATRAQIMVLRDTDGDDIADRKDTIIRLETAGDYPHNGLSGFAFDAFDNVYFGFGENLGASYKLIGSDGTTLSGGGEGGNIYRTKPDGSELTRVATGFWNPFHLAFDAFDRLFAVDNDPDSRPPCRLLHIVQGGDYGYRFRNGRKGLHPFTAWNGELPGTLPMVAGTGEAPSGIVAYESSGLPSEYVGDLIATSWGDHVVQRFRLVDRGASFVSQAETFVRGGESFYPVGIATAPDGSLVVSDWADKSYPLHGKGRIWRIRMKTPPPDDGIRLADVAKLETAELARLLGHVKREIRGAAGDALAARGTEGIRPARRVLESDSNPRARIHALWSLAKNSKAAPNDSSAAGQDTTAVRGEASRLFLQRGFDSIPGQPMLAGDDDQSFTVMQQLLGLPHKSFLGGARRYLTSGDPFLVSAAINAMARLGGPEYLLPLVQSGDPKIRLHALVALRRCEGNAARTALPELLKDADPAVRRAAIQWVGEDRLRELGSGLEQAASQPPVTRELFEAYLASVEMLAAVERKPTDEIAGEDYVAKIALDTKQGSPLRAIALRSLRPDHAALTADWLGKTIGSSDAALRLEAARSLASRSDAASQKLLRSLAAGAKTDASVRLEAVLGLARSAATSDETARVLVDLLAESDGALRREVLRSLRAATGRTAVVEGVRAWVNKSRATATAEDLEQAEFVLRAPPDTASGASPRNGAHEKFTAAAAQPGDAASGQRIFFHPNGPQCYSCHRVNGRGGAIGPDLSVIGRTFEHEKLVRSVLEPSKDIAPQYTTWLIALRNGQVHSGIILSEDPRGVLSIGNAEGKVVDLNVADIEQRKAQDRSVMPDNLVDRMSSSEFRDLVSFLGELK